MPRIDKLLLHLGVAIVLVAVISFSALAQPEPAKAGVPGAPGVPGIPSPCDLLPDGASRDICNAANDPVGTAIGAIPGVPNPTDVINGVTGSVANAIVQPILQELVNAERDAVLSILNHQIEFVNSTTTPQLGADWFIRQYQIVFGMAVFIAIGMFFFRTGISAKDGDPVELGNAGLAIMIFFIVGAVLPPIIGGLVKIMDGTIAPGWMDIAGESAATTLQDLRIDFTDPGAGNNAVVPVLLPLIFLFFGLIGGVLVELMLLFREGMLYVVTAASVITLGMWVGGRWGASAFYRSIMALIALILLKVIMAFILVIGLLFLGSDSGASPVILASVMLLLTPVLSWAAYKKISGHNMNVTRSVLTASSVVKLVKR
jgi:hypothetical protein